MTDEKKDPARFFVSGPPALGDFWVDSRSLAELLLTPFDRDDWTITDLHQPGNPELDVDCYVSESGSVVFDASVGTQMLSVMMNPRYISYAISAGGKRRVGHVENNVDSEAFRAIRAAIRKIEDK